MQFFILADDFTGAADAGINFVNNGFKTIVTQGGLALDYFNEWDVVSLNATTRKMNAEQAYSTVYRYTAQLENLFSGGHLTLFKKIDSGLRGNVGAEIQAMLDAVNDGTPAVVAPAFPSQGRLTIKGVQLINGEPVHKTPTGSDPFNPIYSSNVAELINQQSSSSAFLLPLERIRRELKSTKGLIRRRLSEGVKVFVADAENVADLRRLVRIFREQRVIWVGTGGLAEALAIEFAAGQGGFVCKQGAGGFQNGRPVLVICGSLHPLSRGQVGEFMQATSIQPLILRAKNEPSPALLAKQIGQLKKRRKAVILTEEPATRNIPFSRKEEMSSAIYRFIQSMRQEIANLNVSVLFIGGDTAEAGFAALQAEGVELLKDIIPGVPVGMIRGGPVSGTYICTKSGGFGDSNTLFTLIDNLRGLPVEPL